MTYEGRAMDALVKKDGDSLNIVEENIKALKAILPDAFTEEGIDFDVLRQVLGDEVADGEEKYGLTWHGKKKARQIALTPSTGTLRPSVEESVDWETTRNLFIEGDNLEVLKILQRSYANKVKMIYIDPPYNTGKEFIYPDRFQDNLETYLKYTGQKAEGGYKNTSNTESSGRFHTNWLNMMYPRLKLAKTFLASSGVIFISIDEHEHANLIAVCNEIFGEENYVGSIAVVNNLKGRNDRKNVSTCHEYLVVYGGPDFESYGLPLTSEQLEQYKFEDDDGNRYALRDLRKRGGADKRTDRPKLFFPIYYNEVERTFSLERHSNRDTEILPRLSDGTDGCWRWGKTKVAENITRLNARYNKAKDRWTVEHRVYLNPELTFDELDEDEEVDDEDTNFERTSKSKSFWWGADISTDHAVRVFKDLFGGMSTDYPKSPKFIRRLLQMATRDDDLVLDFFGGFSTTAHAVIEENAADGGRRRYIIVQLPEPCAEKSDAFKKGYRKISEVGAERIRRVIAKTKSAYPNFDGDLGFRLFKLDSSNIRAWNPDASDLEQTLLDHAQHLVEGRSEQDVLYELLLKRGVDLTVPIEEKQIAGKTVYSIGYGVLFACLDETIAKDEIEALGQGITGWHKQLAPETDTQVVFRDSAFIDDIAKTNMTAILEQNGIAHVRSL
jgi:adenine-specific DNA-methyltransferase